MAIIRHIGLQAVNGPLIALSNVKDATFDELVEIEVENEENRQGRIVHIAGDKVIIEVFVRMARVILM